MKRFSLYLFTLTVFLNPFSNIKKKNLFTFYVVGFEVMDKNKCFLLNYRIISNVRYLCIRVNQSNIYIVALMYNRQYSHSRISDWYVKTSNLFFILLFQMEFRILVARSTFTVLCVELHYCSFSLIVKHALIFC